MSDESIADLFGPDCVLLERYHVLECIGEGGFGAVFRAEMKLFDEPIRAVAVKITKQTNLNRDNAPDLFGDAITLAQIYDRIPNPVAQSRILPIFDLGVLDSHQKRGYVIMPLVWGSDPSGGEYRRPKTLADEIRSFGKGHAPEAAVNFAIQITDAMAAVHDLNVIHRDLKPDNILMTHSGSIRIVDFGLAAALNRLGMVFGKAGSPNYMAPEILAHERGDKRVDVFSIGVILYELLTGKHPFKSLVPSVGMPAEQRDQWLAERMTDTIPLPPSKYNRHVGPALDDLTLACLEPIDITMPVQRSQGPSTSFFGRLKECLFGRRDSKEYVPRQRPNDAGEVRDRLEQIQSGDTGTHSETPQRKLRDPTERKEVLIKELARFSTGSRDWFQVKTSLLECNVELKDGSEVNNDLKDIQDHGVKYSDPGELVRFLEKQHKLVIKNRKKFKSSFIVEQKFSSVIKAIREMGGLK